MDHSRISPEEWDLIKHLKLSEAYITKAWRDDNGDVHMELTYEPYVSPATILAFFNHESFTVSKEDLTTNRPDMIAVLTDAMKHAKIDQEAEEREKP